MFNNINHHEKLFKLSNNKQHKKTFQTQAQIWLFELIFQKNFYKKKKKVIFNFLKCIFAIIYKKL